MLDVLGMQVLDGKLLSEKIFQELKGRLKTVDFVPGLAVCLVGDNPASQVYVKNKIKACNRVGFYSVLKQYPSNISQTQLKEEIQALNKNPKIHGLLIQLPLPQAFKEKQILSFINPKKDVDALSLENKALFWAGTPRLSPCTPKGIMSLLKAYNIAIKGQKAVVVGRSQIVGLPMFRELLAHQATVTVCHSQTKNLIKICQSADIVVVCAGKKHLFSKTDFKKGAVVVDVGIHKTESGLTGDVNPEGLKERLSAFSPVPGGVGPMTIASLLQNCFILAQNF